MIQNSIIQKVVEESNKYESNNSKVKNKYLLYNVFAFNYITSLIDECCGTFGTGYPFYALDSDFKDKLPIIQEQIRYNNELLTYAQRSKRTIWGCQKCLSKNYKKMANLKQVCKSCNKMDDELKPRKVINRLPDMDMWMICKDGCKDNASKKLTILLEKINMRTSDVDPIQAVQNLIEINEKIKDGIMPKSFLPIDAHIVEYSDFKKLLEQVPEQLQQAQVNGEIPYLPILPLSYRKVWQYDDKPYNFVHDYLSSLREYNFNDELNIILENGRKSISNQFSNEQLYDILVKSGPESVKRRHETPELKDVFMRKMELWGRENKRERVSEESWER